MARRPENLPPGEAEAARERYLESLRRRVGWQAQAAERLRAGLPPQPEEAPELEPEPETPDLTRAQLEALVEARCAGFPERLEQWRAYLAAQAGPNGELAPEAIRTVVASLVA